MGDLATDYHHDDDRSKRRYTVQLDSGEAFKLKLANVRAEEGRGGASSTGKGKKGKGKGEKGKQAGGARARVKQYS